MDFLRANHRLKLSSLGATFGRRGSVSLSSKMLGDFVIWKVSALICEIVLEVAVQR